MASTWPIIQFSLSSGGDSCLAPANNWACWQNWKVPISLAVGQGSPHTSITSQNGIKVNSLSLLPHLPLSPDLAPSDSYFFGSVKTKLKAAHGRT
jgi:hypothetical protein